MVDKPKKEKKKVGRKPLWDELEIEKKLPQIEAWYKEGAIDKDVAKFLGVSHNVFYKWKREFQEFSDTLKRGKSLPDTKVENALYQRAIGYSHPDIHLSVWQGKVIETEFIKHYPPDPTSMIFWLKNRKPEEWRDKQDIDLNIRKRVEEELADMKDDEVIEAARQVVLDGMSEQSKQELNNRKN